MCSTQKPIFFRLEQIITVVILIRTPIKGDLCLCFSLTLVMRTLTGWERHCIKTGTDCTNGTYSQDHPALDWIEKIPFLSKKDNPDFDTTVSTIDV